MVSNNQQPKTASVCDGVTETRYEKSDLLFFKEQADYWEGTPNGDIMLREYGKALKYLLSQASSIEDKMRVLVI